jgi:hypothetical protein
VEGNKKGMNQKWYSHNKKYIQIAIHKLMKVKPKIMGCKLGSGVNF